MRTVSHILSSWRSRSSLAGRKIAPASFSKALRDPSGMWIISRLMPYLSKRSRSRTSVSVVHSSQGSVGVWSTFLTPSWARTSMSVSWRQ